MEVKKSIQPTAIVFEEIQKRLERVPGLEDQVQLFLLPDPEWRPSRDDRGASDQPKPVILALSKDLTPDESRISKARVWEFCKV